MTLHIGKGGAAGCRLAATAIGLHAVGGLSAIGRPHLPVLTPSLSTATRAAARDRLDLELRHRWIMPILTTHVGSLPRPPELLPFIRGDATPPPDFNKSMADATRAVFLKQLEAGLTHMNDGEVGRRDYVTAARNRMSGFDAEKEAVGAGDLEEMTEFSDKFEGRKGLLSLTKKTEVKNPACGGPISFTDEGRADLRAEIERVVDAAKEKNIPLDRVFFSSPSPGTLATFFDDDFYHDHAKYVSALGAAMKTEYEMVAAAGLTLQVDCPDLAMGRHTRFKELSLSDFQSAARTNVEVMNAALASIPAEQMRMHVCWGNYPGPHHHDVPLGEIIEIVLEAKPKYLSIEACNPGHGHEWEVFKDVKLPADKVLMPGVLDTTTYALAARTNAHHFVSLLGLRSPALRCL